MDRVVVEEVVEKRDRGPDHTSRTRGTYAFRKMGVAICKAGPRTRGKRLASPVPVDGGIVRLTPIAFKLLVALARVAKRRSALDRDWSSRCELR